MIMPMDISSNEEDDNNLIHHKLQQCHTQLILNSYIIWNDKKENDNDTNKSNNDPFTMLNNLKVKLDSLKNKYADSITWLIDYQSIKMNNDSFFVSIVNEVSCELQTTNLSKTNNDE